MIKMASDTKIIYVQMIDGTPEEIKQFGESLQKLKDKFPYEVEFLITNDKIQLHDVKYLLNELIKLYKREKKFKEKKND